MQYVVYSMVACLCVTCCMMHVVCYDAAGCCRLHGTRGVGSCCAYVRPRKSSPSPVLVVTCTISLSSRSSCRLQWPQKNGPPLVGTIDQNRFGSAPGYFRALRALRGGVAEEVRQCGRRSAGGGSHARLAQDWDPSRVSLSCASVRARARERVRACGRRCGQGVKSGVGGGRKQVI